MFFTSMYVSAMKDNALFWQKELLCKYIYGPLTLPHQLVTAAAYSLNG